MGAQKWEIFLAMKNEPNLRAKRNHFDTTCPILSIALSWYMMEQILCKTIQKRRRSGSIYECRKLQAKIAKLDKHWKESE